jgi:hypothetical protein
VVATLYVVVCIGVGLATAAIAGEVMPTTPPFDGFTAPPGGLTYTTMLGGLMVWLLGRHLPAKDKQIADLIARQDTIIKEVVDSNRASLKDAVEEFSIIIERQRVSGREALEMQAAQTTREIQSIVAGTTAQQAVLGEASRSLAESSKSVVEALRIVNAIKVTS